MTAGNGATSVIRGSHLVADEEAARPCWRDVPPEHVDPSALMQVCCPAGSGLFFSDKLLHGAGHNRSPQPRRTILMEWAGPTALPVTPDRNAYQGLRPRSPGAVYQKQTRMVCSRLALPSS
jgi:ectoine hydroxylase-related dioxygenase (phytanoyl-CoA dioxygenase family)